MFRTVKAMAVAGVIAAGFPLLAETANAQTPNTWYLIYPYACQTYENAQAGGGTVTSISVFGGDFNLSVSDSLAISALLKFCNDGSHFWAFYLGGSTGWYSFYTYPGLK